MKFNSSKIESRLLLFFLPFFIVQLYAGIVNAEQNDPPQILTSDLFRKQMLDKPVKVVSFIIIDSDNIVAVTINGEEQTIIQGTLIELTKKFVFKQGKTVITIVATDEAGNIKEKSYLVGLGKDAKLGSGVKKKKKSAGFSWKARAGLNYEIDSNPTKDVSLPGGIEVEDVDFSGVVDDSIQTDSKQSLNAVFKGRYGKLYGYLGKTITNYSKSINSFLNTDVTFGGGAYRWEFSKKYLNKCRDLVDITKCPFYKTYNLIGGIQFIDINVSTNDFSQNLSGKLAIEKSLKSNRGKKKYQLQVKSTQKDFADSSLSTGSQLQLMWKYSSLDIEKLDNYRFKFKYRSGDDGTVESEYVSISLDFDWMNKWEMGLKFDIGFGFASRNYTNDTPLTTNTPLGDTRIEAPFRFSTGLGWDFPYNIKTMYKFNYLYSISNKTPYERIINGVYVRVDF